MTFYRNLAIKDKRFFFFLLGFAFLTSNKEIRLSRNYEYERLVETFFKYGHWEKSFLANQFLFSVIYADPKN